MTGSPDSILVRGGGLTKNGHDSVEGGSWIGAPEGSERSRLILENIADDPAMQADPSKD